ncbi:MAG TPA: prepilin-type N-terminal cleavage/methylation domain-containing protein [Candidatus Angelobacter sp.]|nr:prepilin-type N-terminal cleavage/methylation domain-containing protein [Candidatus Angelobacter sp.]
MKNKFGLKRSTSSTSAAGFSLVELLVAMGIFLVIGGAAVALVKRHVPLFTSQQNQTGLNLSMRNAVAQLQIDVVNAGTGYYQGVNIPSWPVGITVVNSAPGTGCYSAAAKTYSATCFDTLNVIAVDESTPPSNPSDIGANCVSTTSSSLFVNPVGATTLAQLAAAFHSGDQLLLVKSDGSQMTTTILTGDGQVTGGKVKLPHNPTGADGTNTTSADPLALSNSADSNKLGIQFCNTDWVLKLSPITYQVDASDPTNPKLTRTQAGTTNVIAEQIIGFKVGAAIWNGATDSTYNFDSKTYSTPYDWSLIRAVRVSMIGRTTSDITNNFRNSFDGGAYKIESVSVVINPRNLSMND